MIETQLLAPGADALGQRDGVDRRASARAAGGSAGSGAKRDGLCGPAVVLQPGRVEPGINVGVIARTGKPTGAGWVQVVAQGGDRAHAPIGDEAAAHL